MDLDDHLREQADVIARGAMERLIRVREAVVQLYAAQDDLKRFVLDETKQLAASTGGSGDASAAIAEGAVQAVLGNLNESWLSLGRELIWLFGRTVEQRIAGEQWLQAQLESLGGGHGRLPDAPADQEPGA